MIRENILTGEPVGLGSPPNLSSEREAEMNASFGMYHYDPNYAAQVNNNIGTIATASMMSQQPQFNNPYFNQNPMYANALRSSMPQQPQMLGYGMVPQQQVYGYQQPYYPQQQYGIGYNPAAYCQTYNPYSFFKNSGQRSAEEYKIFVEPLKPNGDYIRFTDQQERLDNIIANEVKRTIDPEYYDNNYGRYYNAGYYYYGDSNNQIIRDFEDLKRKNMENRKKLDIQLSKLCHHYLNDGVTDQQIEDMYNGYTINTGVIIQDNSMQRFFDNMQPYDDSWYYRQRDCEITEKFYKICGIKDPEHCGLQEFFDNIGAWGLYLEQEKIRKERSRITGKIDVDAYKYSIYIKSLNNFAEQNNLNSGELVNKFNQQYVQVNTALGKPVSPIMINPAYAILDENNNVIIPDNVKQVLDESNQYDDQYKNLNKGTKNISEEEKEKIKQNLARFPTLSNAVISDDGTINIDYGYDIMRSVIKSYKADALNENEEQYAKDRNNFINTIMQPNVISQTYFPPPGTENPNCKIGFMEPSRIEEGENK